MAPIVQDLAVKSTEPLSDPIIRALYYADPTDENTFAVDDQFMLGEDLLIAPIVEPMSPGRTLSKNYKINNFMQMKRPRKEVSIYQLEFGPN